MAVIDSTTLIPNVRADFHLLEIDAIEAVEQAKFGAPDVLEPRLKVQLHVCTPGAPAERFVVWMSPKLSEKATFGAIARAVLGHTPNEPQFDTDGLIGRRFRSMTAHNERGWPRLVPGTAAPETWARATVEPPF
jgi:hypothetical protein